MLNLICLLDIEVEMLRGQFHRLIYKTEGQEKLGLDIEFHQCLCQQC